jgi:hypothetical protein
MLMEALGTKLLTNAAGMTKAMTEIVVKEEFISLVPALLTALAIDFDIGPSQSRTRSFIA